ncbi:MAG: GTP-binding protein [Clostridia bacterium]|nr:GTP-binding protein [Clostridia bacterium]
MTKIDIFSGFLGAGKTTLIKKLIKEAYKGEKIVLIENEFGDIGIDGGFLKESGIQINEMNSGCICCSLVGDFGIALKNVLDEYHPDRIIIEPSGVGKLSDVIKAVKNIKADTAVLNSFTTIVDAEKCKMYMKNFGEFFKDQIESAGCIVLSHTDKINDNKLAECLKLVKESNDRAVVVTTSWDKLDGNQIKDTMEQSNTLNKELLNLEHEHHHHHHGEECEHCHDEHEHHHHDEHEHHHHDEHEHHHHHADEVFSSWGKETVNKYTVQELNDILNSLNDEEKYGIVLRAKGIVSDNSDKWIHFDYIPDEIDIRYGTSEVTGRICVIGSELNEKNLSELFRI